MVKPRMRKKPSFQRKKLYTPKVKTFSFPLNKDNWVTGAAIAVFRSSLLKDQGGVCAILREPMEKPCLDHDHYDGKCRGVIGDRVNMFEGRIQKLWSKYLEGSTSLSLSEALRSLADYLEIDNTDKPLHGQIVSDVKKGMLRRTKETISRNCTETFGVEISQDLSKEDMVKEYLRLFVDQLEKNYLYESY